MDEILEEDVGHLLGLVAGDAQNAGRCVLDAAIGIENVQKVPKLLDHLGRPVPPLGKLGQGVAAGAAHLGKGARGQGPSAGDVVGGRVELVLSACYRLVGGALLGWGAMTGLGCTIGTLLSGSMAGALSGWVFGAAVFTALWLGFVLRRWQHERAGAQGL